MENDIVPMPCSSTHSPRCHHKPRQRHRVPGAAINTSTPHSCGRTHPPSRKGLVLTSRKSLHLVKGRGWDIPLAKPSPCTQSPTILTRHPTLPSDLACPTANPTSSSRTEVVLWKGCHFYQKGIPVPEILTTLWPTLSMIFTSILH